MQTACAVTQTMVLHFAQLFNYLPWRMCSTASLLSHERMHQAECDSFGLGTPGYGGAASQREIWNSVCARCERVPGLNLMRARDEWTMSRDDKIEPQLVINKNDTKRNKASRETNSVRGELSRARTLIQNVALVMHLLHPAAVNIWWRARVFVICSAFHAVCSRINQPIVILIVSHNRLCMRHKSKLQSTHKYENTTRAAGQPGGRAVFDCLLFFPLCIVIGRLSGYNVNGGGRCRRRATAFIHILIHVLLVFIYVCGLSLHATQSSQSVKLPACIATKLTQSGNLMHISIKLAEALEWQSQSKWVINKSIDSGITFCNRVAGL